MGKKIKNVRGWVGEREKETGGESKRLTKSMQF